MADTTSSDWVAWGKADPYLAVMGFLPNGEPWDRDAFYAAGEAEWESLANRWSAYGVDTRRPALDVGCGAGRLTLQMAMTFPEVVGVDVSPDQVALAQEALSGSSTPSAFHVTDGSSIPVEDHSVAAVFSANVFQHLEQSVADALVAEVVRVLAPGGSAMLHIPVAGSNFASTYLRIVASRPLESLRVAAHRTRHLIGGLPPMRRRVYDTARVISSLERSGLVDVEMSLFHTPPGSSMYHSFFFARKPPS